MRSVVSDVSVHVEFRKRCHSSTASPHVNCRFQPLVEEYQNDSDDSDNDVDIELEELFIGKLIMTKSRRQVKVWTRFNGGFRGPQNGKPGHTNLLLKPYDL